MTSRPLFFAHGEQASPRAITPPIFVVHRRVLACWPRMALLFLTTLWMPHLAQAHDKWIEVEPAASAQATAAKIYLATGEALKNAEYLPERRAGRIAALELRSAASVQDLRALFREDAQPILRVDALPTGTSLVRLDTQPVDIELPADKFSAYLLEERLIDVLFERKQRGEEDRSGRERYSRSLKALVQVGPRADPHVTQPIGQTLELVPLSPPHALSAAGTLAVRVLFRGQPLAGCALAAAQRHRGRTQEVYVRSDAQGIARFAIEPRGQWLLHTVHMHRTQGNDAQGEIDWRSHWASLYFAYAEPAQ